MEHVRLMRRSCCGVMAWKSVTRWEGVTRAAAGAGARAATGTQLQCGCAPKKRLAHCRRARCRGTCRPTQGWWRMTQQTTHPTAYTPHCQTRCVGGGAPVTGQQLVTWAVLLLLLCCRSSLSALCAAHLHAGKHLPCCARRVRSFRQTTRGAAQRHGAACAQRLCRCSCLSRCPRCRVPQY